MDREVSFSGNLKSTDHGLAVSALHGNLLEMPNLCSQPDLLTLNLHFNMVTEFFECTVKFNKHCLGGSQRHLSKLLIWVGESVMMDPGIRDHF